MEDAKALQEQATSRISRLTDKRDDLKSRIESLDGEMQETKNNMKELLDSRNKEQAAFANALKADAEAVDVLNQAIVSLTAFYKKFKIPMTLVQEQPLQYSLDPDKAPELAWQGQDRYTGRKALNRGIVSILSMLVEDYTNEMKISRSGDAKAQEGFEAERQVMNNMLHTQKESYVDAQQELAEMEEMLHEAKSTFDQLGSELSDQAELKKTLHGDCFWFQRNFQYRRKMRKAELDGLADAKNLLAGAVTGNFDELLLSDVI